MRLIYFDIDTRRPDHLGCYGYPSCRGRRSTIPRTAPHRAGPIAPPFVGGD